MAYRKDEATNTWIVDISGGKDAVTGKRRRFIRRNVRTRKEAIQLEQELRMTKFGNCISSDGITMDGLFQLMKKADIRNQRKDSYMSTQEYNYKAHFAEYFKNAKIDALTYEDMETFRETLQAKGLSNNTVNKLMIQMKKLLDIAVKNGYLKENPCIYLKKLKVVKKKMDYWTVEEFKHFMTLFEPDEYAYKLFFKVAFLTGMRVGELLGLTWEDVDFKNYQISVNKTLINLPGGRNVVNDPKTAASARSIAISRDITGELKAWKEKQTAMLAPYTADTETLQVFQFVPQLVSRFMVRNTFDKVMQRTDKIKRIRIHDLRHSHVALLISHEEEPYPIKERVGHASISTTYDIYGHLYPSKQKGIADNLEGLI